MLYYEPVCPQCYGPMDAVPVGAVLTINPTDCKAFWSSRDGNHYLCQKCKLSVSQFEEGQRKINDAIDREISDVSIQVGHLKGVSEGHQAQISNLRENVCKRLETLEARGASQQVIDQKLNDWVAELSVRVDSLEGNVSKILEPFLNQEKDIARESRGSTDKTNQDS